MPKTSRSKIGTEGAETYFRPEKTDLKEARNPAGGDDSRPYKNGPRERNRGAIQYYPTLPGTTTVPAKLVTMTFKTTMLGNAARAVKAENSCLKLCK